MKQFFLLCFFSSWWGVVSPMHQHLGAPVPQLPTSYNAFHSPKPYYYVDQPPFTSKAFCKKSPYDSSSSLPYIIGGLAGAVIAANCVRAWNLYCYEKELYGNKTQKHTWNYLEELFPTPYEMVNAEGEFVAKLHDNMRRYKKGVGTDPLVYITFVNDAQQDEARLVAMREKLEGNRDSSISASYNDMLNATVYRLSQKKQFELIQEIDRYQKRLAYILRYVTSSYELTLQLAQSQGSAHVNYKAPF